MKPLKEQVTDFGTIEFLLFSFLIASFIGYKCFGHSNSFGIYYGFSFFYIIIRFIYFEQSLKYILMFAFWISFLFFL